MSLRKESNNHRYNSHNYHDKQEIEELGEARIITKNLVYILGLSSSIANREKLSKYEYLGQYGNIIKIVVNKNKAYNQNSPHGPSYSAYVTFSKPSEASIAILSLDDTTIDNHLIRASFGTTKYCSYFLKGIDCSNKECVFLHKKADDNDIIKRGDLTSNKMIFIQQHDYAEKIADIYNPEVKRKIMSMKKRETIFPSPDTIYDTIYVQDKNVVSKNNNNLSKNNKNYPTRSNENLNNKKRNYPVEASKTNKEIKNKETSNKEANNKKNNNYNNESYDNDDDEEEEEEEDDDVDEDNEDDEEYELPKVEKKNLENQDEKNKKIKINNSNNISINNKNNQQIDKRKKLFSNREKSRFNFCVKNNEGNTNINVPKHILNLINKKINLYNLTKYMQQKVIDKIFLKETIKDNNSTDKNDEWTNFIKENIEQNNNNYNSDEFINDIDNINHFILNKVTSQVCAKDNAIK